ncbi:MAG: hypothetical protein ABJB12_05965, partial [Pseudomonadota bacterium]
MPAPTVPRRLSRLQGFKASVLGSWLLGGACAAALLASQSDCGFPSYDFSPASNGGTGGSSGGAGPGGSGGTGALAGASGSSGNSGDEPGAGAGAAGAGAAGAGAGAAGAAGDAGAAGSGPGCSYPPPVLYPAHCVDDSVGANETGLDCGGPDCLPCETNQPCVHDSDCASGTCTPVSNVCTQVLSLRYLNVVAQSLTIGPKFRLVIDYKDAKATLLSSLRIRYYFNHNGVAEPVIALDTQATVNVGVTMDISDKVNAQVFRLPPGPPAQKGGLITDSYLEISFSSALQLG